MNNRFIYLLINLSTITSKLLSVSLAALFAYYIYVFISLTPYQYAYLNKLNGAFKENPLVKDVIEFITKDKKRSICTPFS